MKRKDFFIVGYAPLDLKGKKRLEKLLKDIKPDCIFLSYSQCDFENWKKNKEFYKNNIKLLKYINKSLSNKNFKDFLDIVEEGDYELSVPINYFKKNSTYIFPINSKKKYDVPDLIKLLFIRTFKKEYKILDYIYKFNINQFKKTLEEFYNKKDPNVFKEFPYFLRKLYANKEIIDYKINEFLLSDKYKIISLKKIIYIGTANNLKNNELFKNIYQNNLRRYNINKISLNDY